MDWLLIGLAFLFGMAVGALTTSIAWLWAAVKDFEEVSRGYRELHHQCDRCEPMPEESMDGFTKTDLSEGYNYWKEDAKWVAGEDSPTPKG